MDYGKHIFSLIHCFVVLTDFENSFLIDSISLYKYWDVVFYRKNLLNSILSHYVIDSEEKVMCGSSFASSQSFDLRA